MTQLKKVKIANPNQAHRTDSSSGYNWSNDGYAFDPNYLERSANRQKAKAESLQRYYAKRKVKREKERDTRQDYNKRFGPV